MGPGFSIKCVPEKFQNEDLLKNLHFSKIAIIDAESTKNKLKNYLD